jgi:hypothetical protein
VLGAPVVHDERGFSYVHGIPGAPFESLDFVRVPKAKTVRNLIHPGFVAAGVFALLTARAILTRQPDEEISRTVLADPDGNWFCAFTN